MGKVTVGRGGLPRLWMISKGEQVVVWCCRYRPSRSFPFLIFSSSIPGEAWIGAYSTSSFLVPLSSPSRHLFPDGHPSLAFYVAALSSWVEGNKKQSLLRHFVSWLLLSFPAACIIWFVTIPIVRRCVHVVLAKISGSGTSCGRRLRPTSPRSDTRTASPSRYAIFCETSASSRRVCCVALSCITGSLAVIVPTAVRGSCAVTRSTLLSFPFCRAYDVITRHEASVGRAGVFAA